METSCRTNSERTPGIFACYRFPPVGRPGKSHELGELRWYFLPDGSTQILTTIDEINRHIASERDTPRPLSCPLKYRRDRLKAIEAHIRSHDLKARKSITMAQVAGNQGDENRLKLVAWMDVVAPEESGSAVSVSTLE
jgi:hypothetical protein